ncbi:permease-like cell division protein FtsX [Massilia sp. W12]|uniref:cell division protein FtsX n=1 Tax=Massilia sp. W12 TaxID=3126507 RepID=UPI0030CD4952
MKNWWRQQSFALAVAFAHLRAAPAGFAFNVLVVACALALPLAGFTLLQNLRPLSAQLAVEPELSIFLKPALTQEEGRALGEPIERLLQQYKVRARMRFVPREEALAQLQARGALADVLGSLGQNPLPDSWVLQLEQVADPRAVQGVPALVQDLKNLPGVDVAQVDSDWVKRLAAFLQLAWLMLAFIAATLMVVVLVVVFNTVRLQVLTRLPEISVSRLVGASDSFIHRPFLYGGAMLGLCAGLLALGMVALTLQPFNRLIAELAHLYASEFQLRPLALIDSVLLLVFAILLGWCGAWLSVRRHLQRMH